MKVKTFAKLYKHKERTVHWFLLKHFKELDDEAIVLVNQGKKRKRYDIIEAESLDILIRIRYFN